jgi:hypothetical protein
VKIDLTGVVEAYSPSMISLFSAAAVALTGLAIAGAAPAQAGSGSSGMAAEFPVGRCIAVPNDFTKDFDADLDSLIYDTSVPCTDPSRDYRVVAQTLHEQWCGPETQMVFNTRDMLVLCVVQDWVGMPA